MNAHSFAMMNLFVAFGFTITDAMGIFGTETSSRGGFFHQIAFLFGEQFSITIPRIGLEVTGIEGIAIGLALLTIVVLQSHLITDKGAAMAIYASIFFSSVFLVGLNVFKNFNYPGVEYFYSLYFLIATLSFIYMLVQMASGGQKIID